MGSTNATGISVVSKENISIRNRGGRQVYKTDAAADIETTLVSSPPIRVEGSGSIVRDNGSVERTAEIVNGLYLMGRSTSARVASTPGITRDLDVELGNNKTIATVPDALVGTNNEKTVKHTGTRVVIGNGHDDSRTRASDSGAYSPF